MADTPKRIIMDRLIEAAESAESNGDKELMALLGFITALYAMDRRDLIVELMNSADQIRTRAGIEDEASWPNELTNNKESGD